MSPLRMLIRSAGTPPLALREVAKGAPPQRASDNRFSKSWALGRAGDVGPNLGLRSHSEIQDPLLL